MYPPNGPANFQALVEPLSAAMQDLAWTLRAHVQESLPEAKETVSGGAKIGLALYSINDLNDVVCGIQPTRDMCKVFFHGWEALKAAGYRLEGSGRHARHVKLRTVEDVDPNTIRAMVRLAADYR